MTDSMIERVALGIAAANGYRFLRKETTADDLRRTFGPTIFRAAPAAIGELRNPTDAMVMAAKDVIDKETLALAQISLTPELMRAAIAAFVDAALSETTT